MSVVELGHLDRNRKPDVIMLVQAFHVDGKTHTHTHSPVSIETSLALISECNVVACWASLAIPCLSRSTYSRLPGYSSIGSSDHFHTRKDSRWISLKLFNELLAFDRFNWPRSRICRTVTKLDSDGWSRRPSPVFRQTSRLLQSITATDSFLILCPHTIHTCLVDDDEGRLDLHGTVGHLNGPESRDYTQSAN